MTPNEAYQILGLPEGATLQDIKEKFRSRAKVLHPDTGGPRFKNGKAFVVLKTAYKVALKDCQHQRKARIIPTLVRVVPRNRVFKVKDKEWTSYFYVPRAFCVGGGKIHVIGCENEDGTMDGILLPEFVLTIPPIEEHINEYGLWTMIVSNLTPRVRIVLMPSDDIHR